MSPSQPRVLIFTHDGRGLGHLRRLSRIAKKLQERAAVLLITGHRAASWMMPEECEFVHIPSLESIDIQRSKHYGRQPFLYPGPVNGRDIRHSLIESVFSSFQPDALILDYLAMGQDEEMFDFVKAQRARHSYFILRGVLGEPAEIQISVFNPKSTYLLENCYDRIFVAADRNMVDVGAEYNLSSILRDKLFYTGYVTHELAA